ncbi:MAG: 50S ribosomal protein L11 methyltransferase [Sphingobacteriaceae bacterium]
MDYYELIFKMQNCEDYQQDLLIQELADLGFDTFEVSDEGFKTYISSSAFAKDMLDEILFPHQQQFSFSYEINHIPYQNWNEIWESNFEPIHIKDQIYVRAAFHPQLTGAQYEIVIDPKMAFGTGHHETTSLMMEWMLETDYHDKTVLDMGSGTGILAILASKMGALAVTAIDYDPICFESILENSHKNNISNILPRCGSKEVIPQVRFDIILANINRNILIDQMESYVRSLKKGGDIFFSGFYEIPDLQVIIEAAGKYSLKYDKHKTMNDWVAAKFTLQA